MPALVLVRVDHRSSMAGNNGGMTSACHVPDEQLARFAATVSSAVRTSGLVVFADKAMPPSPAPPVVARTVGDQLFTIIDRPRSTTELVEPFAAAGIQLSVNAIGPRFVLGQGRRL